ncbi:MAG: PA0069 family radical SAM protein [Polyangiaceae bacterium]
MGRVKGVRQAVVPSGRRRARGSLSNPANRFDARVHESFDDGWEDEAEEDEAEEVEGVRIDTVILPDHSRSILVHNDSPDIPFSTSINPYRGCEHGCSYCFARPSHAYLGLSAGLDFETRILAKRDAPALLLEAWRKPSYRVQPIALGPNTDAYQPVERQLGITRALLALFAAHRHPVGLVTKSELVLRDRDLLSDLGRDGLAHVFVSLTTLDPTLARRMEPRAASPRGRLRTIRRLAEAGVPVGVLVAPMIPGLNDHELEAIVAAAAEAGATRAGTVLLRLPHDLKALFVEWLEASYPLRRDRVLGLLRDCRGGALSDARFGDRMRGQGPYADLLQRRATAAARRHGMTREPFAFDLSRFRPPDPAPRDPRQLPLFGRAR